MKHPSPKHTSTMFHYIDHKDRQGAPRTACGLNACHAWTPTFWDRVAFLAYQGNPRSGTGPADRCKHCERAATGTKHQHPRTFDEYAGRWAAKLFDYGKEREAWTSLGTIASNGNANARYNAKHQ